MLCTLIGAIILFKIQVGLNMHLYDDVGPGMHRRSFEGRHLVFWVKLSTIFLQCLSHDK